VLLKGLQQREMADKSVINLSDVILTKEQLSVLSKGLKFCPTPGLPDPGEQREDLDKFHRRMRQIACYDDPADKSNPPSQPVNVTTVDSDKLQSTDIFGHRKFKLKSTGRGPIGPPNLEAMIVCNEQDFNSRKPHRPPSRQNLTLGERKALRDLLNDNRLIFKPADKGQSIVCLNRLDYLK
jgi:hypothetical protein